LIFMQAITIRGILWYVWMELHKQLIGETKSPIITERGEILYDYEYERKGTANIFMYIEPLTGDMWGQVTQRRTAQDWAESIRLMVDHNYPDVDMITLIMDNLNTHSKASLYEAFEPSEAKRIADKLNIHYTPRHGSWLNIAEIALNMLGKQCTGRRIESITKLRHEFQSWIAERMKKPKRIDWQFTTKNARIKLKRLYPRLGE